MLGSDTLLTADYFYVWKPYFDWLQNEDPHYRVVAALATGNEYRNSKKFNSSPGSRRLMFRTLNINDTIVVCNSFDPLFKKGDMILSINGVTMPEYMKYNYADRYAAPLQFMLYYYYSFAVDKFQVRLVREGKEMEFETTGLHPDDKELNRRLMDEEYNIQTFPEARCGYIQIKKFYPVNTRLIGIIRNAILDFKKNGCTNVVLDLRTNPGGNGHAFDKLLSIFIDRPVVPYIKSQKLKVSTQTLEDYKFITPDMIGTLVDIPDKYLVKEFKTDPKMYVGGMNYYVMVSRYTGSVAASFVNALQYNGAAALVGEPLMRNALKYGEAIRGGEILPALLVAQSISTTEIDEYTKAVDGVIMPDIPIHFIAKDYLTGKDAMLEKLLSIIPNNN